MRVMEILSRVGKSSLSFRRLKSGLMRRMSSSLNCARRVIQIVCMPEFLAPAISASRLSPIEALRYE